MPPRAQTIALVRCGVPIAAAQSGRPVATWDCLRERMVGLLAERGPGRSICPGEVARACAMHIGGRWQDLMPQVRAMAHVLEVEGIVEAIQHVGVVRVRGVRGPIRLRLRRHPQRAPVT
jgi:hypothetical protein